MERFMVIFRISAWSFLSALILGPGTALFSMSNSSVAISLLVTITVVLWVMFNMMETRLRVET